MVVSFKLSFSLKVYKELTIILPRYRIKYIGIYDIFAIPFSLDISN